MVLSGSPEGETTPGFGRPGTSGGTNCGRGMPTPPRFEADGGGPDGNTAGFWKVLMNELTGVQSNKGSGLTRSNFSGLTEAQQMLLLAAALPPPSLRLRGVI